MAWRVGIDEAGYGPNLGPMVQAAVAMDLPDDDDAGWQINAYQVRRASDKKDKRILIDDSKKVHSGQNGLAQLERALLSVNALSAATILDWLSQHSTANFQAETWFDPSELLPIYPNTSSAINATIRLLGIRIMLPTEFNNIVTNSGSKATALSVGLAELLLLTRKALPSDSAVSITCDMQGGKRYYAPMLQATFAEGWVHTLSESADESRYRIDGLSGNTDIRFCPRADSESMAVALASITAKYTREILMRQFNRYWQTHVPGLKSTAGYPGDAKRFYNAIQDAMTTLGISEQSVWRVK